jgi:hypothetical protein
LSLIVGASVLNATMGNASNATKPGAFDNVYPGNTIECLVCHTGGPGAFTSYGNQYVAAGGTNGFGSIAAIRAIDKLDADNDGIENGFEINAGDNPNGTATSTGTASVTGCMTSSVTTPLMMFLAMLCVGLFVRRKRT